MALQLKTFGVCNNLLEIHVYFSNLLIIYSVNYRKTTESQKGNLKGK